MDNQRFELIKAALTGLLANPNINAYPEYLARMAIRQADEVLAELEKEQSKSWTFEDGSKVDFDLSEQNDQPYVGTGSIPLVKEDDD